VHALESPGPVGAASEGNAQGGAERRPDCLAIQRVGAAGAQQNRVDAEREGVAERTPDVVGIREILEQEQEPPPRDREERPDRLLGRPLGQSDASLVEANPGDLGEDGRGRDVDRDSILEHAAERLERRRRDQRGTHPEAAGRDQDANALAALDREQPATLPEVRVLEVAVVLDTLVARGGDAFELHGKGE
jgi:hypothetical protein